MRKPIFRIVTVLISTIVSLLLYQNSSYAGIPSTYWLAFRNAPISAVKHNSGGTTFNSAVSAAVSNWDLVTTKPAFSLAFDPGTNMGGDLHYWERDYNAYWAATWDGSFQPHIYVGSTLTACVPMPAGWPFLPACSTTRTAYGHIRLNTYTAYTALGREVLAKHETGHALGLAHNGCYAWSLQGVMADAIFCQNKLTYIAQHEADTVMTLFP